MANMIIVVAINCIEILVFVFNEKSNIQRFSGLFLSDKRALSKREKSLSMELVHLFT